MVIFAPQLRSPEGKPLSGPQGLGRKIKNRTTLVGLRRGSLNFVPLVAIPLDPLLLPSSGRRGFRIENRTQRESTTYLQCFVSTTRNGVKSKLRTRNTQMNGLHTRVRTEKAPPKIFERNCSVGVRRSAAVVIASFRWRFLADRCGNTYTEKS